MKTLKTLRRDKRITQDRLAKSLGVSRSAVSMWEIDLSEPDIETVKKIADFFGTTVDYLLGHEQKESAPDLSRNANQKILAIVDKMAKLDDKKLRQANMFIDALLDE